MFAKVGQNSLTCQTLMTDEMVGIEARVVSVRDGADAEVKERKGEGEL